MREGLDNIMTTLSPLTSSEWETVMNDVRRLLHVWESKESDAVARSVVLQIEDMLKEFSQPTKVSPKLMISESSRIPVISHVVDHPLDESDSDADDTCNDTTQDTKEESVGAPEPEVEEEEEEEEPDAEVEADVESEAESEVEADAEADAEVEMEVEQITVRGKTYWYDPSSRKLFTVLEDDEVGDEIGLLVNGKIQTLIKE
jgi:hypothetical protein